MICERCNKRFDSRIPELNSETYGDCKYACPHCGQAYIFRRIVRVDIETICDEEAPDTDDWGNEVVTDEEYNREHQQ